MECRGMGLSQFFSVEGTFFRETICKKLKSVPPCFFTFIQSWSVLMALIHHYKVRSCSELFPALQQVFWVDSWNCHLVEHIEQHCSALTNIPFEINCNSPQHAQPWERLDQYRSTGRKLVLDVVWCLECSFNSQLIAPGRHTASLSVFFFLT